MSKLYLYNYNNYFNRIFKKEASLTDYGTPIYSVGTAQKPVNFNYNDGVETSHTINYSGLEGDYVIVTDNNDTIESRWFVTEMKRTRGGQNNIQLRRDLFVDLYSYWSTAPMILHRGWIKDGTNPLIFNSEGFNFNQIKKSERLLQDRSYTPWYALYFAKNTPRQQGTIYTGNITPMVTITTPISESIYGNGIKTRYEDRTFEIWSNPYDDRYQKQNLLVFNIASSGLSENVEEMSVRDRDYIWFNQDTTTTINKLHDNFAGKFTTINSLASLSDDLTANEVLALESINNQYVKDSTNNLYLIKVSKTITSVRTDIINSNCTDYLKSVIDAPGSGLTRTGDWGDEAFQLSYNLATYTITAQLETSSTISWEIDFSTKQNTLDADYNIVVIPAADIVGWMPGGPRLVTKACSDMLLRSIISTIGTANGYLYDVQLLPYCPYQGICDGYVTVGGKEYGSVLVVDDPDTPIFGNRILDASKSWVNDAASNSMFLFYVTNATFTFDINESVYAGTTPIDLKIENETTFYRLCSPNYSGAFDFSVAKNGGVQFFNVDVTMRPYNPYIHINPNFKNLYGGDYDDPRGLICQGDFSLPIVTDQFKNYEYNNKNYMNVFARNLENLDFNQTQERVKAAFGLGVGVFTGAIGGAVGGAKIGGPIGGAVGGALGGIGSTVGGIVDYSMLTARQNEEKDLTIDLFNYNLGNVKALAYSINKVTPYTKNNKIWPVLEEYSCTYEEEEILRNKITYSSFKLEVIGTLSYHLEDGVQHFLSATLIRSTAAKIATHELNELYYELEKGVYI